MTRDDLERWEDVLMKEVVTRRALGGYSPEATTIYELCRFALQMTQEMLRKTPRPRKRRDEDEEGEG